MTQFVWDSAKRTFVCTDEGVSASVEFYCPANYPNYVGTYRMRYGSSQSTVTISQKIEGVSYTLRGLPQFDIEVSLILIRSVLTCFTNIWGNMVVIKFISVLGMPLQDI